MPGELRVNAQQLCSLYTPEKQSMREAMVHLLARYLEMRPLFFAPARPMKVEWKMSPYLGVLPRVFRALRKKPIISYGAVKVLSTTHVHHYFSIYRLNP